MSAASIPAPTPEPATATAAADEATTAAPASAVDEHIAAPATEAPTTAAAPVAEARRLPALDVLRGFALLGIVVMNIGAFASPRADPAYVQPEGLDAWLGLVRDTLFDGRMRGLFSMLFGAGLMLMAARCGRDFADHFGRRCVALIVLGVAHAYLLLWPGDILFIYGVCGLLLFPFRALTPRTLLLLAGLMMGVLASKVWVDSTTSARDWDAGVAAEAALAAGETLDDEQQSALEAWQARVARARPDAETLAADAALLRAGWWPALQDRLDAIVRRQGESLYLWTIWDALAAMLLGMALMGWGFFTGAWSTRALWTVALLGYALGVPGTAALTLDWYARGHPLDEHTLDLVWSLQYQPARLATALGHAAVLMLIVRAGRLPGLTRRLAAAGRLALTIYVGQTVVYVLLFTGVGLGLGGRVSVAGQTAISAGMAVGALILAPWWLVRFRQGPLEWLLRWATYGERGAFRRGASEVPVEIIDVVPRSRA